MDLIGSHNANLQLSTTPTKPMGHWRLQPRLGIKLPADSYEQAMRLACEEARLRQEAAEAYARESAENRRFGDEDAAAAEQQTQGSLEASAAEVAVPPEAVLTVNAACT
ncbi:unnamed protein product [Symbiodinium sp. CCMP2592]|nr:unnamed protein product [Symbiodinium sp. CCMP2592]